MIGQSSTIRLLLRGLSTFSLVLATAHALDLTPQHGFREGNEGAPTPVIQFTDGTAKVDYRPLSDWQPSGGGDTVTFFTEEPRSWMKLNVVPKASPPPVGAAAAAPENLQEWATRFIPTGARETKFVKVVPSPFTIGTRQSNEFIFSFTYRGVHSALSVSVIDLNDKERLVMLVSAKAGAFAKMRQQAISSMFSWSTEG